MSCVLEPEVIPPYIMGNAVIMTVITIKVGRRVTGYRIIAACRGSAVASRLPFRFVQDRRSTLPGEAVSVPGSNMARTAVQ